MEISEVKKSNKYVALVTYLIAVVCLILGLFLPLFDGKGILALQLPDALNALAGKSILSFGKEFTLRHPITFYGSTGITFDSMALIVLIYAIVTVLSLLALIPVAFSFKKEGKVCSIFAYIIEIAAALALSLYLILGLYMYPTMPLCYNLIIALSGSVLALIVLSIANKGAKGVAKTFLFIFSVIAFLMLFNITRIIPKLAEPLTNFTDKLKLSPNLVGIHSGVNYLIFLFEGSPRTFPYYTNFTEYIKYLADATNKACGVFLLMVSVAVAFNYFVDLVSLSTNGKKVGHIFNMARYSFEIAAIICLFVTAAVAKLPIGLLLIIITVFAVIQLLMSVIRFLMYRKRADEPKVVKVKKQSTVNDLEEIRIVRKTEPKKPVAAEQLAFIDPPPRPAPEPIVMDIEDEARPDGGEQLTINEHAPAPEPVRVQPAPPPVREVQPEPVQPVAEVVKPAPEPVYTEPPVQQPEPVRVQPTPPPVREEKPVEEVTRPAPVQQPEPVQPNVETRIYTINTIYGGPTDDFLRKLSNDEKIEFARTFIEKSNGAIGNIPEYVIGGNNKNFFSSVFIYLGRIRSMISDSLLNKMYKELNMM